MKLVPKEEWASYILNNSFLVFLFIKILWDHNCTLHPADVQSLNITTKKSLKRILCESTDCLQPQVNEYLSNWQVLHVNEECGSQKVTILLQLNTEHATRTLWDTIMDKKLFSFSKSTILKKQSCFANKIATIMTTKLILFRKTILASWIAVVWSSIFNTGM